MMRVRGTSHCSIGKDGACEKSKWCYGSDEEEMVKVSVTLISLYEKGVACQKWNWCSIGEEEKKKTGMVIIGRTLNSLFGKGVVCEK